MNPSKTLLTCVSILSIHLLSTSCSKKADEPVPAPQARVVVPPDPVEAVPAVAATPAPVAPAPVVEPLPGPTPEPEPVQEPEPLGPVPYDAVRVLVIGVNDVGPSMAPLRYAESDARDIAKLFREDYRFEVTELIGPEATALAIKNAILEISNATAENEDMLLYFAGHGATLGISKIEQVGVILPADAAPPGSDLATRRAQSVEIPWIMETLLASAGRHRLAILDSCFSGYAVKGGESSVLEAKKAEDELNPLGHRSVQLMSAGLANERAVELDELGGGLLSVELKRELSHARLRSLYSLFLNVGESVKLSSAQLKGSPGTPQLRRFVETKGDFFFIEPIAYLPWSYSKEKAIGIASGPLVAKRYSEDVSVEEMEEVVKSVAEDPETARAQVPDETYKRYEARASLGDAEAQAILSALLAASEDEADQAAAFDLAFSAFEGKSSAGKWALGNAYSKGAGVEADTDLGQQLIQDSGLSALIEFARSVHRLDQAAKNLREADTLEEKLGAGQVALGVFADTGKNLMGMLARDSSKKVQRNLGDAIKALSGKKVSSSKAQTKLLKAREFLEGDESFPPEHRDLWLAQIDSAVDLARSEPDAALAAIDAIIEDFKEKTTSE